VRPVNLIPLEQRRAARGQGGLGISLATRAFLGVLALAVLAVFSLVLISNQVNSKKSALADLSHKQQAAEAEGNALRPYGEFVKLQQARTSTVTGLARSRFNWERVLRQLSRAMPPNVWITSLSGTVSGASAAGGATGGAGGGGTIRNGVQGPAVDLQGCARSQSDSARMMARMRTLDDVSSVTLTKSEQADASGGGSSAGSSAGAEEGCPRYQFDMLVAFKAEATGASTTGAAVQPAAAGTTAPAGTTGGTGAATGSTSTAGTTGTTGAPGSTTGGPGQ
jgi:Tfp pilus assembly protein PilN